MRVEVDRLAEIGSCSRCENGGCEGIRQTVYLKEGIGISEVLIIEICQSCVSKDMRGFRKTEVIAK